MTDIALVDDLLEEAFEFEARTPPNTQSSFGDLLEFCLATYVDGVAITPRGHEETDLPRNPQPATDGGHQGVLDSAQAAAREVGSVEEVAEVERTETGEGQPLVKAVLEHGIRDTFYIDTELLRHGFQIMNVHEQQDGRWQVTAIPLEVLC